jgi:thiamine transporter ThiT
MIMNVRSVIKGNKSIRNLTASAMCLALCMVLPLLTGQIPQIGAALSPMHIPMLLCGFITGPYAAAVIGLIAPLLRFMIFGMPPLVPTGIAMCFELAAYGIVSGLLYKILPKKTAYIYVSLIAAMIIGRIIWGIARVVVTGVTDLPFTFEMFITGALVNAIPGIIVHIALIPVIVMALKKAGVIKPEYSTS